MRILHVNPEMTGLLPASYLAVAMTISSVISYDGFEH
jgi:hypothetical protein